MKLARLLIPLALLGAGCGASGEVSPRGPTVAPSEFDGAYMLTGWTEDGRELAVTDPTELVLDTAFGSLSLETSCGVQLGSFSLLEDGRAGVTIAGGRSFDCPAAAARQQEMLVDALDQVDAWSTTDGTLTFLGPEATLTFEPA